MDSNVMAAKVMMAILAAIAEIKLWTAMFALSLETLMVAMDLLTANVIMKFWTAMVALSLETVMEAMAVLSRSN